MIIERISGLPQYHQSPRRGNWLNHQNLERFCAASAQTGWAFFFGGDPARSRRSTRASKGKPGGRPGRSQTKQKGGSYDPFHEIRDEVHHGRGDDQPSSQEALIQPRDWGGADLPNPLMIIERISRLPQYHQSPREGNWL